MSRTKTIEYDEFGVQAKITVAHATVAMGLERSRLTDEGLRATDENLSAYERTALWMQWPAIKAGIIGGLIRFLDDEGQAKRDIDLPGGLLFEDFLILPEELAVIILSEILELNPHWSLAGIPRDEAKKKLDESNKTNSESA